MKIEIIRSLSQVNTGMWRPVIKTPFGRVELPVYQMGEGKFTNNIRLFEDQLRSMLYYEKVE